ncbi:hypothetical protein SPSYN_01386 [Sporotomaculum syntrophicum]|uniref:Uncharacterized protein n=1 Tax=Sporotomaculum syntrophicum TaxID=182264 RepID=A0A9D2WQH1_9FIRM|nr:CC/Se motif family (seleno)protein [Sporotomaculum syntrophicum]KAF1085250.1 hypothetical protein SPSYN_01386 [Sporotomaculum syntrophicum]
MSVINPNNTHDVPSDSEKMIRVEISEDAKSYILGKGGVITVMVGRAFGCTDNASEPVVLVGKSRLPESFDEVLANGIKVYIFRGVVAEPNGIKISLGNLRGVPTLKVEGIITY